MFTRQTFITCMIAATVAVCCFALASASALQSYDLPRKCFSKRLWSGPDRERPCIRVWKVYEDGSGKVVVETAQGEWLTTRKVRVPW